jgi:pyruvate dehydrogenase E2 component (dihydrolipoamide acetyltransferase)
VPSDAGSGQFFRSTDRDEDSNMAQLLEMPKLSDTMTEGVVRKWVKKEGDKIAPGEMVAEVETDKATMDFESFDEGTILKLLVADGTTVPSTR